MLRLLKYEFRKTRLTRLVLLGSTLAVQLVFFIGVLRRSHPAVTLTSVLLLFLAIGGTAWVGLECVLTLHRDIRTRQSFMLFMTDRSCFGILGAKLLQNAVTLTLTAAVFVGLGYLDTGIVLERFRKLSGYWQLINGYLQQLAGVSLKDGTLIMMGFLTYAATWLSYITAACFAEVLANVWLPGKRISAVVAFLMFALIAYLINLTQTALPALPVYQQSLLLACGVSLFFSGILYVATALLMDRRLSV